MRCAERQISEMGTPSQSNTAAADLHAHSPARTSALAATPATFASEATPGIAAEVAPGAKLD